MKYIMMNYLMDGITLKDEDIEAIAQPGSNDVAVQEAINIPYIKKQLDSMDSEALAKELDEYGAWSEEQLDDHEENKKRILWIAAHNAADGDCHEEEEEEKFLDCPLCNIALTKYIEDSEEIRECEGCGAEWEESTGTITLNPNEL
jgi:hypothetical protein